MDRETLQLWEAKYSDKFETFHFLANGIVIALSVFKNYSSSQPGSVFKLLLFWNVHEALHELNIFIPHSGI